MTNDENVAKHEMVDDASSPCTTTAKARALAEAWNHRKESGFQLLREGVSIPARSTTQLPKAKQESKAAASVVTGKIARLFVQLLVPIDKLSHLHDSTLIAKALFFWFEARWPRCTCKVRLELNN